MNVGSGRLPVGMALAATPTWTDRGGWVGSGSIDVRAVMHQESKERADWVVG